MLNLSGSSMNGRSNPKPNVNTLEDPSNPTSTYSPYLEFLVVGQLCGEIVLSFLRIPMTIVVYLLSLYYSISN